jgi:hypothetical protein
VRHLAPRFCPQCGNVSCLPYGHAARGGILPGYSAATWSHRYTDEHSDLLNGAHGRVYLDMQQPRVCIRGPEVRCRYSTVCHASSAAALGPPPPASVLGLPFRACALHGLSHATIVSRSRHLKAHGDLSNRSAVASSSAHTRSRRLGGRARAWPLMGCRTAKHVHLGITGLRVRTPLDSRIQRCSNRRP